MRRAVHALAFGTIIIVSFFTACSQGQKQEEETEEQKEKNMQEYDAMTVRRARGSGRWFPGNAEELKTMVNEFIDAADVPAVKGRIVGAIAPHAGYVYSGGVAGHTFRAIRDNAAAGNSPDTVVVLGFTHRGGFRGVALMDGSALETPLGKAILDKDSATFLAQQSQRIFFDYRPHQGEHSAENEMPFLQTALPNGKFVLALIGDHDAETRKELVSALAELAKKKKTLVVASTDLLHHPDYDRVTRVDKATLALIEKMDGQGLQKRWKPDNQICCGIGPVLAVIRFAEAQGCKKGQVLFYRNSGDDHPESRGSYVVGYGAVVFAKE